MGVLIEELVHRLRPIRPVLDHLPDDQPYVNGRFRCSGSVSARILETLN